MTTRELSIEVAKVRDGMRLVQFAMGCSKGLQVYMSDQTIKKDFAVAGDADTFLKEPDETGSLAYDYDEKIRDYAGDVSIALELVHEMNRQGVSVAMRWERDGSVRCIVKRIGLKSYENGETEAEAICLAYLEYMKRVRK